MIWVIGGTSDARQFMDLFKDKSMCIVTVASKDGQAFFEGVRVKVGKMNEQQMKTFIEKENIGMIVDLSHPFAKEISASAKKMADYYSIPYLSYQRQQTDIPSSAIIFPSFNECIHYVKGLEGTVFFTSGVKHLGAFEAIKGNNRFVHRIIPSMDSLQICYDHQVSMRDIIAGLGPYSKEFNKAVFKAYKADYVVTKDSGPSGGTKEKLEACIELGITPIVITRTEQSGFDSLEALHQAVINKV